MHTLLLEGLSPIILSVPHDGTKRFDDAPTLIHVARWRAQGATGLDDHTLALAYEIVGELLSREIVPTLVGFELDRGHADPNRKPGPLAWIDGFEESWRGYHRVLSAQIERALCVYGHAFLLDIHGFAIEPTTSPRDLQLILGTDEGKTAPNKTDRFFAESLKRHYTLAYSPDASIGVRGAFRGGYIVRSFGYKFGESKLDAVQLEVHTSLRDSAVVRNLLAHNIAVALENVVQTARHATR